MKSLRDYYLQVDEPNPIAPTILSRIHGTKSEDLKLEGTSEGTDVEKKIGREVVGCTFSQSKLYA